MSVSLEVRIDWPYIIFILDTYKFNISMICIKLQPLMDMGSFGFVLGCNPLQNSGRKL